MVTQDFSVLKAASLTTVAIMWSVDDEEEEDLMFSPALMARRASESWIDTPPIEVRDVCIIQISSCEEKTEFVIAIININVL